MHRGTVKSLLSCWNSSNPPKVKQMLQVAARSSSSEIPLKHLQSVSGNSANLCWGILTFVWCCNDISSTPIKKRGLSSVPEPVPSWRTPLFSTRTCCGLRYHLLTSQISRSLPHQKFFRGSSGNLSDNWHSLDISGSKSSRSRLRD